VKHAFSTRNRPWLFVGGQLRLLSYPLIPEGGVLTVRLPINSQVAGRYIVFTSDRFGRQDVYLFDALERRLIDCGLNSFDAIAADPAVSENGRYIVFSLAVRGG